MTTHEEKNESEILISLADLKSIWRKKRRRIAQGALICALIVLLFRLVEPIQYEAYATFREKGKTKSGIGAALILMSETSADSDALTTMRSQKLLEEIVKTQGLQGEITKDEHVFPLIPFATIKNNILTEYALFRNLRFPLVNTPIPDLKMEQVVYADEVPTTFRLVVVSEDGYVVEDMSGKTIGTGSFGIPFSTDKIAFTIKRTGPDLLKDNAYELSLLPLRYVSTRLNRYFTITQDKNDKTLIKIVHKNADRKMAAKNANLLMDAYLKYVQCEHENLCQSQINYLRERQEDAANHLEAMMLDNVEKYSADLSTTGFATSDVAMEFLASSLQNLAKKLLEIDFEINRLDKVHDEDKYNGQLFCFSHDLSAINTIISEKQKLNQQADSLRLSLGAAGRRTISVPEDNREIEDIKHGLDLIVAKEIYGKYVNELSELESQARQHNYITQQMDEPGFKITPLCTILSDPISLDMIVKTNTLLLNFDDYDNRSSKERERLVAELAIQKDALKTHVEQSLTLIHLRQDFVNEKIVQLQRVLLALLEEQVTILDTQLRDGLSSVLEHLKLEKVLMEQNLMDLRSKMATLPKQWAAEQMVNQQMNINRSIVEEVSKVVESKNIANNLETFQSLPLDLAVAPLHPRPAHLVLFTIAGAIAGAFLSFVGILAWSVAHGLPASPENLRGAGYHVSGSLSGRQKNMVADAPLLDSDLDTLRRLTAYMTAVPVGQERIGGQSLVLLEGSGPDYSASLADLMSKMGQKVVIVDARFDDYNGSTAPGILQYLEDKISFPSIVSRGKFDFIGSGGICRYSNELLSSKRFQMFMTGLKERYDWVIVSSSARPEGAEAISLLDMFPCAVLSMTEQPVNELTACLSYAKKPDHKISFVFVTT